MQKIILVILTAFISILPPLEILAQSFDPAVFIESWCSRSSEAVSEEPHNPVCKYAAYKRPDYIPLDVWEEVEPNLLPEDHPVKEKLDKIFSKPDVNKNGKTLVKAGFRFPPVRTILNAVVAKHPKLKGYLIKTFTDEQPCSNEWSHWLCRIRGAELIAAMIEDQKYQKMFKVPKKWIYMIPRGGNSSGKSFLLVVEDMKLEDFEKNKKLWSKKVTTTTLDALYNLIETLGLLDSVFIDNIPFSKDGRIAFIDTEHTLKWPVPFHKLNGRLSDKNRDYWIRLTQQ